MSAGFNNFLGDTPTQPIAGNYPGVTLIGEEPNGVQVDIREINGFQWTATNAYFDQGLLVWVQSDPTRASTATVSGFGQLTLYQVAAGAPTPIQWGTPIFQAM